MQPPAPEPAHRRASSSTTTSAAAPRRSVGCMAGLLRLFSPYHRSHHRKRLTAKSATPTVSSAPPSPPPQPKKEPSFAPSPSLVPLQPQPKPPSALRRRRSCDAPRSPTIAPEYRRASCDSPRPPPPAIVARLMGLEESAPPSPAMAPRPPPPPPPETAAEKRRKLLGALEKCDEDLKTLRRIIAAVRAAEMRSVAASDVSTISSPAAAGKGPNPKWIDCRDEPPPSPSPPLQQVQKPPAGEQHPSPDSVLDAITSPRFPCRKRPSPCTNLEADSKPSAAVGSKVVKPSRTLVFSGDYCKVRPAASEPHGAAAMHYQLHHPLVAVEAVPRWMPPPAAAAEAESWRRWDALAGCRRSRAMVESVGEVWGQAACEALGEAGRVAVALESAILHDLVGDVVSELLAGAGAGMCRRRLCF